MKRAMLATATLVALLTPTVLATSGQAAQHARAPQTRATRATPVTVVRDTEQCATFAEYERIHDGMTVGEVRQVFDIAGSYRDAGPDTFAYVFRGCGSTDFRVVFSSGSGLSIRKNTVD